MSPYPFIGLSITRGEILFTSDISPYRGAALDAKRVLVFPFCFIRFVSFVGDGYPTKPYSNHIQSIFVLSTFGKMYFLSNTSLRAGISGEFVHTNVVSTIEKW